MQENKKHIDISMSISIDPIDHAKKVLKVQKRLPQEVQLVKQDVEHVEDAGLRLGLLPRQQRAYTAPGRPAVVHGHVPRHRPGRRPRAGRHGAHEAAQGQRG